MAVGLPLHAGRDQHLEREGADPFDRAGVNGERTAAMLVQRPRKLARGIGVEPSGKGEGLLHDEVLPGLPVAGPGRRRDSRAETRDRPLTSRFRFPSTSARLVAGQARKASLRLRLPATVAGQTRDARCQGGRPLPRGRRQHARTIVADANPACVDALAAASMPGRVRRAASRRDACDLVGGERSRRVLLSGGAALVPAADAGASTVSVLARLVAPQWPRRPCAARCCDPVTVAVSTGGTAAVDRVPAGFPSGRPPIQSVRNTGPDFADGAIARRERACVPHRVAARDRAPGRLPAP